MPPTSSINPKTIRLPRLSPTHTATTRPKVSAFLLLRATLDLVGGGESIPVQMGGGDDWDLEAVVRSCRFSCAPASQQATTDPSSSFPAAFPVKDEEDVLAGEERNLFGGSLEELCKPFFSKPQLQLKQQQQQQQPRPAYPRPVSQVPRSKRRKNQQKKVVCHVPADGLASDVWAWRKYGQKPIKGSPYPRGYYRCSSSKGCQARKQVERSRADPGVLIVTYTAEHNHPVPNHRNSLAGSTRSKLPAVAAAAAANGSMSPLPSPTTSLNTSMEDELLPRPRRSPIDDEEEDEEEEELMVEDMEMVGDDELLFVGLNEASPGTAAAAPPAAAEEVEDVVSGFLEDRFFRPPWLAKNQNAAAAAGGSC